MLYKMSEWETSSGWHCGNVEAVGKNSNAWWYPARILKLSPADYIAFVINQYKPDYIHFNKQAFLFTFSWKNQSKMREFKNFINRKARESNFQIEV